MLKKNPSDSLSITKRLGEEEFELQTGEAVYVDRSVPGVVGMAKGFTINLGNYESERVEVWYSDFVGEDETPRKAIHRISGILDKILKDEAEKSI